MTGHISFAVEELRIARAAGHSFLLHWSEWTSAAHQSHQPTTPPSHSSDPRPHGSPKGAYTFVQAPKLHATTAHQRQPPRAPRSQTAPPPAPAPPPPTLVQAWPAPDLYSLLGLPHDAASDEIKQVGLPLGMATRGGGWNHGASGRAAAPTRRFPASARRAYCTQRPPPLPAGLPPPRTRRPPRQGRQSGRLCRPPVRIRDAVRAGPARRVRRPSPSRPPAAVRCRLLLVVPVGGVERFGGPARGVFVRGARAGLLLITPSHQPTNQPTDHQPINRPTNRPTTPAGPRSRGSAASGAAGAHQGGGGRRRGAPGPVDAAGGDLRGLQAAGDAGGTVCGWLVVFFGCMDACMWGVQCAVCSAWRVMLDAYCGWQHGEHINERTRQPRPNANRHTGVLDLQDADLQPLRPPPPLPGREPPPLAASGRTRQNGGAAGAPGAGEEAGRGREGGDAHHAGV
jgi:hypothetical protein